MELGVFRPSSCRAYSVAILGSSYSSRKRCIRPYSSRAYRLELVPIDLRNGFRFEAYRHTGESVSPAW